MATSDAASGSPEDQAYKKLKFDIAMSCGGCSGAVERNLKKIDELESFEVSLDTQSAEVVCKTPGEPSYAAVLDKIRKTGKTVKSAKGLLPDAKDDDWTVLSVQAPAAAA